MEVHWESHSSIKRFLFLNALLTAMLVIELNAFYLKAILWVPPRQ